MGVTESPQRGPSQAANEEMWGWLINCLSGAADSKKQTNFTLTIFISFRIPYLDIIIYNRATSRLTIRNKNLPSEYFFQKNSWKSRNWPNLLLLLSLRRSVLEKDMKTHSTNNWKLTYIWPCPIKSASPPYKTKQIELDWPQKTIATGQEINDKSRNEIVFISGASVAGKFHLDFLPPYIQHTIYSIT